MKKTKNLLAIVAMMLLVAMLSVMGTVAWLVATSETVENTFTVGSITIKLDETDVDDSTADKERDTANSYKIIPGDTLTKDPTVTVIGGSEACYVYVSVENQLVIDGKTVATPAIDTTNWAVVDTDGTKTLYVYVGGSDAAKIVPASASHTALAEVFKTVKIDDGINETQLPSLAGKKIIVNAYAHQSDTVEFTTVETAAKAWFATK